MKPEDILMVILLLGLSLIFTLFVRGLCKPFPDEKLPPRKDVLHPEDLMDEDDYRYKKSDQKYRDN